jgi:RHS repeat-associated protein
VVDNDELYEYDASDELVAMNSTRFRWDRVGQLVEKDDPAQANPTLYEWNAAHRLAKVTLPDLTSAEYRYNSDELRIWRREPSGAETNYYWMPSGILGLSQVLNETDGNGARKADYVLGPNGLIALIDGSGHERYYVFDALGSVLALTDETGAVTDTYAYDEYGVEVSATGTSYNPMRYTGQQWDSEESLYYLRNRACTPGPAIFLRRDPLGPLMMQLYAYVNASPANHFDPTGLLSHAGIAALVTLIVAISGVCIKRAYDYADQTLLPKNDKLAHCYFYCSFVRCTAAVLGPLLSAEAADIIGLTFEEMQGTGLIRDFSAAMCMLPEQRRMA